LLALDIARFLDAQGCVWHLKAHTATLRCAHSTGWIALCFREVVVSAGGDGQVRRLSCDGHITLAYAKGAADVALQAVIRSCEGDLARLVKKREQHFRAAGVLFRELAQPGYAWFDLLARTPLHRTCAALAAHIASLLHIPERARRVNLHASFRSSD